MSALALDLPRAPASVPFARGEVAGPDEASVPGLPIVAALTSAWGICPAAAVVWFQIGPVSV